MMIVYVLQTLLPLVLILWLAVLPPRNLAGFCMLAWAASAMTLAAAKLGIWAFPPWWVPYLMALLVLGAVVMRLIWSPGRKVLPGGAAGWLYLFAFAAVACFASLQSWNAMVASKNPQGPTADIAWPLGPGIYLVVNGGASASINAHAALLDPSIALHNSFGGSSYGVDLIAVDRWGFRVSGILPADPVRYLIFGTAVLAPCAGQVILAEGDRADMQVPEVDEGHPAGNHVLLRCDGIDILLAHFQQGSLRVAVGDALVVGEQIAEVGNSGNSSEPHLHIHAQMPGRPDAPFGGNPVALRLDGGFLVRGDRVNMSAGAP